MTGSIRALLDSLIDYAGLYPPAGLDMASAVRNFAEYRKGEHAWALGKFIVAASRLEEFAKAAPAGDPWPLSVLVADPKAELPAVAGFTAGAIQSIEMKAETEAAIEPRELETFYEIPLTGPTESLLMTIRGARARAKVRTGGVTPEMIPAAGDIAQFLVASSKVNVPFKATAGLHHPLRCVRPLTYEAGSATALMHGFLNVFLAAAFARSGLGRFETAGLLEVTDPSALRFDDDGLSWGDRRLTTAEIAATRRSFALSFGSCSFREPIDELRELKLL